MTTSGTYAFNPGLGEVALYAFNRIGVRRSQITAEHMVDAHMASNMVLSEWSNRQVNLWKVQQTSIALTQGVATYAISSNIVMMLDAVIETSSGSTPTDRVVTPISRSEYSSYPNKQQQGPSTVYWFDRLLSPSFTLWPVPDGNGPYTFNFYNVTQMQDAVIPSGVTVDIPYSWLRAFSSGLEAELCPAYAPEREQLRRADAERSFALVAEFNTENVPFTVAPNLSGYFRK